MDDKSLELLPPEGDPEVGKKVFAILDEILEDKKNLGLHKMWNRYYELVKGKHWKQESIVPLVAANLVYRHRQQTVNQLTDNNPTFNISRGPNNDPRETKVYEDLQRAATHWWSDQEQQDILESSVINGETYGICIEKVMFNPDLEGGLGEIETIVVDPRHFGWYPLKLKDPRLLQQSIAVVFFQPMTVLEANRKWPGNDLKADSTLIKAMEDERRNVNSEVGKDAPRSMMVSLASVAKEILNWGSKAGDSGSEELVVCEMWVHDNTTETIKQTNVIEAVGEEVTAEEEIEIEQPKYPGGIRYVVVANGDKVLEDRPNPSINLDVLPEEEARKTYLYDKFPFCAVNSVKDTVSAWGMSDIEQLEGLNVEMNKALSQLVLDKDRAVRRKWINPLNSGVPNSDFTNFQSILNPADEKLGAGIRVLDFPAIPVDINNSITLFKDLFFLISATFEVDQAQMGRDVLAYKSIAALIERVATMMRGKIRSYGRLTRERGRMFISCVQNYYTEDRWINYEDEMGIQTTGVIRGNHMIVPAKLTVVTGSTLPTSKVQQREEAVSLYREQAIDRQELLSSLEWSGRSEVIKRMNQGPIGAVMSNFATIGMPDQIVQFLQQIGSMEPKELQKGLKEGSIPPFQAILQQIVQGEMQKAGMPQQAPAVPPLDQADMNLKAAEADLKRATTRKVQAELEHVMAERDLTMEKVNTERVDQEVKREGMRLDTEKIKMDKARTVSEIVAGARDHRLKAAEVRSKVTGSTPGKPTTTAPEPPIVPEATAKPSGYNEVGLSGNNKEV